MYLNEFVRTIYPIQKMVKNRLEDPMERVMNEDDLPYDFIGPDESGVVTKLVRVSDDRCISVMDLLTFSEDEISKSNDAELREVWYAYMDNVNVTNCNVIDIMEAVKQYAAIKEKRKCTQ